MPLGALTRDEWVEDMARLICIRDPLVELGDARLLAVALWDRPLAGMPDEAPDFRLGQRKPPDGYSMTV